MERREILFRGQTRRYGEKVKNAAGEPMESNWVYGGIFPNNDGGDFAIIYQQEPDIKKFSVYADTVGQYTGLTDKNGKKIFEGDIVSNEWCLISGNSVVKFGEYRGSYMSKEYQQGHYGFHLEHLDPSEEAITRKDMMYFANRCEVIGNIHDNPELIKE